MKLIIFFNITLTSKTFGNIFLTKKKSGSSKISYDIGYLLKYVIYKP